MIDEKEYNQLKHHIDTLEGAIAFCVRSQARLMFEDNEVTIYFYEGPKRAFITHDAPTFLDVVRDALEAKVERDAGSEKNARNRF